MNEYCLNMVTLRRIRFFTLFSEFLGETNSIEMRRNWIYKCWNWLTTGEFEWKITKIDFEVFGLPCSFLGRNRNKPTKPNLNRNSLKWTGKDIYVSMWSISFQNQKIMTYTVSSALEGRYQYSKMFCWEPEGRYRCSMYMYMAIALFWCSTEHLWIVIAPFWLWSDNNLVVVIVVNL